MLKRFQRYIFAQVVWISLLALVVLTLLFFIAGALRALHDRIHISQFVKIAPFVATYTLPYTLPAALLAGVTMTFSRLAADREILALRTSGVSFSQIVVPLLILGVLLSSGMYYIEAELLPDIEYKRKSIIIGFVQEFLSLETGQNKTFRLPGYQIFCSRYTGSQLYGLVVHQQKKMKSHLGARELPVEIIAREGRIGLSPEGDYIVILLKDVAITYYGQESDKGKPSDYHEITCDSYQIDVNLKRKSKEKPRFLPISEIRKRIADEQGKLSKLTISDKDGKQKRSVEYRRRILHSLKTELYKRYAEALCPLLFVLLAFPIPVLVRSSNRMIPFLIGLAVAGVFNFAPAVGGKKLATQGLVSPEVAMGAAPLLTLCVIVALFWRLRKM